ncbi:hypothetical protein [Actinomadura rubrisoli]|uniref:Uncharacterized protein n=1 Tax=Actinomadura rubrisoli TaxID=2530368 RepID=A0A4R5A5B6_9ACTN|nr:hypothetical protein [Actinomadura rubrisoli]TDD66156.1 hypothetical protein E1298_40675 [Actinomadura rubrisoli]
MAVVDALGPSAALAAGPRRLADEFVQDSSEWGPSGPVQGCATAGSAQPPRRSHRGFELGLPR